MDPATSYPRGNDRVESRRSASLCRGSNKWQVFINSRPDSALGDDSEEKHVASIELCEQNETREDCENVTWTIENVTDGQRTVGPRISTMNRWKSLAKLGFSMKFPARQLRFTKDHLQLYWAIFNNSWSEGKNGGMKFWKNLAEDLWIVE